jgi:hypothetical protein
MKMKMILEGFNPPDRMNIFFNEFLVVVASLIWALIGDNGLSL